MSNKYYAKNLHHRKVIKDGDVYVYDEGLPEWLDGVRSQYSLQVKRSHCINGDENESGYHDDIIGYVFDLDTAIKIAKLLNNE